jgi:glucose-6-phosphate isomerase
MLRFDFSSCMSDAIGWEHGVTSEDVASIQPRIASAHGELQKWRASKDAIFMDYPFEAGLAARLRKPAAEIRNSFDNLVVLGIGGSALGLRSLAQALLPPYANLLERKWRNNAPRLFVCDNIDPDYFGSLLEVIDVKDTCFHVISKSGNTTETMSQFFVVLPILKARLGRKWKDHLYVITDPEVGPLRKFAAEEDIQSFEVPRKLGGRYSALSAVGLLPAACVGIDIEGVIDGAREMVRTCSGTVLDSNPAYKNSAVALLMDEKKGKTISVMMPYADRLALFADWYAQLTGESLGKNGLGITPVKALGSTDQHSQIQLYMEGPNDKVITFIGVEKFQKTVSVTNVMESFEHLKGHDLGGILQALQKASTQALTSNRRPNITITVPAVTPQAIGELFMFYEIGTAFLGALLRINPFDQPGVELGKKLTKKILQENR